MLKIRHPPTFDLDPRGYLNSEDAGRKPLKKQKATALRNDLLNLFLDGKKKKLTDIGLVF